MRILDRRFANDLAYLLDRDGPDEVAQILLRVANEIGVRGSLEVAVWKHVRARHPGRRRELFVIEGDHR
jgi:hypothetical protein